ncbi:hypothetical protein MTL_23190, partial [Methylobacterium goesingense]|uniref:VCBS repeat-containing protein n=1 Tax=Methylobacterium goesingense TaxID=243690 RepID=UPI0024337009
MTIYYVDASSSAASDQNSGRSMATPFASLDAVNKLKLQAGDTVAFKAGTTYTASAAGTGALNIAASGTEAAPITFTTYGLGAAAVINNNASGYSDGINIANSKYIVVEGLNIGAAGQAGINVMKTSSYVTVRNIEASNVGEGVMLNGTNNLVTRSYFHDLKMIKNTPDIKDDDYGAVGILIGNSNNEVSFNRVTNGKAASYDYTYDGGGIELFGNMDNIKIHDNWVENSVGFIEAGGYNNSLTNISITNNVSLNNNGFMVLHNGGGGFASKFSNVDVSHNSVIEQNNSTKQMASVFLDAAYKAGQIAFHDNAMYLNTGDSFFKQTGDYHYNNVFYMPSSATHLYNNWEMTLNAGERFSTLSLTGDVSIVQALAAQSGGAGATLVTSSNDGLIVTLSHTDYVSAGAFSSATGTYQLEVHDTGTTGRFEALHTGISAYTPNSGGWGSDDRFPRELADVNGDGRADIVGFGQDGVYVSLATGNGHFAQQTFEFAQFGAGANAGGWASADRFPRELADVNGDGRADIVGFGQDGVYVSLATGNGHFAQQ